MTDRQIKHCLDGCPFWHFDVWDDEYCSETNKKIYPTNTMPPIWCPLREAPITVSLVQVQDDKS